jgi:putative heme iron utilization protein
VGYNLDKEGNPIIVVASESPEAANIGRSSRCSLLVQPISYPARGVASVALQGSAAAEADQSAAPDGTTLFKLEVDSCVYYGGLDQVCMAEC